MIRLPKWVLVVLAIALVLGMTSSVMAAEAKGKIKSIGDDQKEFVLTDADGKDWTFHMNQDAKVRLNDNESKINELKAGDEVTVTYEKKGDKLIAAEVQCKRK